MQRASAAFFLVGLIVVGCAEPRYYPVRGVVQDESGATLKELDGAVVEFEAVGQSVSAVGEIQPDGSFVMTSERDGDGCLPGEHRVVIGRVPVDGDRGALSVVDPKYHRLETSELTVTVKKERNEIPLRLKRISPNVE